jgi:hypothetical protein
MLAACPKCGKKAGRLVHQPGSRFPYHVTCGGCGWFTDFVKLESVAVKLWNDARKQ